MCSKSLSGRRVIVVGKRLRVQRNVPDAGRSGLNTGRVASRFWPWMAKIYHEVATLSDFTQQSDNTPINQASIDVLLAVDDDSPATPQDYIKMLLAVRASDVGETIPSPPPFYSIPATTDVHERTECLSILTQFFLANLNIYCKARGISAQNFGTILDASPHLSNELVHVAAALTAGDEVESQLCDFCNAHVAEFGLSRPLTAGDVMAIKQKFERTYRTVTATKENPHMDDFMILDCDATGEAAKFVIHQGSICTDFSEIVDVALPNQDYFTRVRVDFEGHPAEMPHKNEWVAGDVEIEPETLFERITDEQFERLPNVVKVACRARPTFQMRQFLFGVAKGRQDEADVLLTASTAHQQDLLRSPGVFTDYSGRTFNCTSFEYAYWAKDTHMCRMLEGHMDVATKAVILKRINAMERNGLTYEQHGVLVKHSKHFDFTPLITALTRYVQGFNNGYHRDALIAAWMAVGMAQRDMPVHVVNEYCRPDRPFDPLPEFNEENLPRSVRFYNFNAGSEQSLFPLAILGRSGLGVDFALYRTFDEARGIPGESTPGMAEFDLAAVSRLDKIRTIDLTRLRENLEQGAADHGLQLS